MNISRRLVAASATALALSIPATSQAATPGVFFDFAGAAGTGVPISKFVYSNISVLCQYCVQGGAANTNLVHGFDGTDAGTISTTPPRLFIQGQVSAVQFDNVNLNPATINVDDFTFEVSLLINSTRTGPGTAIGNNLNWTMGNNPVYDIDADSSGTENGGDAVLGAGGESDGNTLSGFDNYFRLFHTPVNPTNSNANAAPLNQLDTGFGFSEGEANTAGQTLILEGAATIGAARSNWTVTSTTTPPLDGIGGTLANSTLSGTGSISLTINICEILETLAGCDGRSSFVDTSYFRSDISSFTIDINLGNSLLLPYNGGIPERIVNQTPDLGSGGIGSTAGNDFDCEDTPDTAPCDMIFEVQAGESRILHLVPEPGSVALLGLGLTAFGGLVRRRRRPRAA